MSAVGVERSLHVEERGTGFPLLLIQGLGYAVFLLDHIADGCVCGLDLFSPTLNSYDFRNLTYLHHHINCERSINHQHVSGFDKFLKARAFYTDGVGPNRQHTEGV